MIRNPASERYEDPVPAWMVPFTHKLLATVEVPLVPFMSMNPAKVEVAVVEVAVM